MRSLTLKILFVTLLCFFTAGCLNPFAPELGDPAASLWTDQQNVGELLNNFKNSYNLRDSLRYADCLEESFMFLYYDIENEREDQWGRDTDLKATGGLFRNFDEINLTWHALPSVIEEFASADSSLEFEVSFTLSLYGSVTAAYYDLYGLARFTVRKPKGESFRILTWKDNTYF